MKELLTIKLAEKFAPFDTPSEAFMVDEVPAVHTSQEGTLLVIAHDALQVLHLDLQAFAFQNVPSGVPAEVAGEHARQEVVEF
jgi:ABC-type nitrate/sulfonate/bicarbonate transport system ATPase subunit